MTTRATTVTESIEAFAKDLESLLTELLTKHSSMHYWDPGNGPFIMMGHHGFDPLTQHGKQLQAQLLERYRRFCALLRVLLREHPDQTLKEFDQFERRVVETIQQNKQMFVATTAEALQKAVAALQSQAALVSQIFGSDRGAVFVPDTNSMLWNTELESWRFDGVDSFMLLLVPAVTRELDELKLHRNRSVSQKANKLVRQIKEYRRRGFLTDGVPLVSGVSTIRAIAVEPRIEASLPWLDPDNADDRILASTIEAMRLFPRASVTLVTRDLNLHNKAEFARVPTLEPPDPTRQHLSSRARTNKGKPL